MVGGSVEFILVHDPFGTPFAVSGPDTVHDLVGIGLEADVVQLKTGGAPAGETQEIEMPRYLSPVEGTTHAAEGGAR